MRNKTSVQYWPSSHRFKYHLTIAKATTGLAGVKSLKGDCRQVRVWGQETADISCLPKEEKESTDNYYLPGVIILSQKMMSHERGCKQKQKINKSTCQCIPKTLKVVILKISALVELATPGGHLL